MADDQNPQGDSVKPTDSWMSDVQRALALILIITLAVASMLFTFRLVYSAPIESVVDLAKIMLAALVNMALIALGFFFGSSQSKEKSDASQQKIVEKLTSTAPPGSSGPVAPVPAPIIIVAWWSKLTPEEQAAITAAGATDPRTAGIAQALSAGTSVPDDLSYLVSKGLLTQERASAIQAS